MSDKFWLISWGCKEQMPISALNEALDWVGDKPVVYEVETQSYQCAVLVGPVGATTEEVQKIFDNNMNE